MKHVDPYEFPKIAKHRAVSVNGLVMVGSLVQIDKMITFNKT